MTLNLRPAIPADLLLIFSWSNDPLTRQNSFSQKPISIEEHTVWFNRLLENPLRKLYILTVDGVDAGQVRLDFSVDGTRAEISYSIAPEFRGRGFGKKIIELAIGKVRKEYKTVKTLVAEVKPGNTASNRIFARLGFEEKCIVYSMDMNKLVLANGGGYKHLVVFVPFLSMPQCAWRRKVAA